MATALTATPLAAASAAPRQQSSIVIDYDTGQVLHADQPDAPVFPASLTKMMTLYLVFEALDAGRLTPDARLKVSDHAAAMPPTKLGLKAGSSIRVEDAILALVTKSANDMASAIAENLGGSEELFAAQMTRTARRLGMGRTTFRNASGLPDPEQRTTARDFATLATRLITDHPRHYRYFSRQRFSYAGRTLGNHNRLLAAYAGMDGIKTGYTNASGFNLAASAVRGGRRLVAVVMGGSSAGSRDVRMAKLLDRGFVQLAKTRPGPSPAPTAPALGLPGVEMAALDAAALLGAAAAVRPAALASDTDTATSLAPAVPLLVADPALAAVAAAKAADVTKASSSSSSFASPPAAARRAAKAAGSGKSSAAARTASAASGRRALGRGAATPVTYGVLVGGVHAKSAEARRAAGQAMRRAPSALKGTFVSVNSLKRGKRAMFQAQLVGLDRLEAEAACKHLRRGKQACEVVRAGPLTVASN